MNDKRRIKSRISRFAAAGNGRALLLLAVQRHDWISDLPYSLALPCLEVVRRLRRGRCAGRSPMSVASKMAAKPKVRRTDSVTDVTGGTG